jgi:hypothetical protein
MKQFTLSALTPLCDSVHIMPEAVEIVSTERRLPLQLVYAMMEMIET